MNLFGLFSRGLKKTRNNLVVEIDRFSGKVTPEMLEELEELLIMADVGVATASKICSRLGERIKKNRSDASMLKEELALVIEEMMQPDEGLDLSTTPSVIMVVGVNGVGKTTTIGKLAGLLTASGKKVILGAADTFRAAASEQLSIWAERTGCRIVTHAEGADPAAVVYDSISAARAKGYDVVICDTAGRLHNKKNLMEELKKIDRVIAKDSENTAKEVLLVLDATTGQNGLNQAKEFASVCGVTGIVLTKLDGTAKGGVVIAIRDILGIPIKYVGTGEGIDDIAPFDSGEYARALLFGEEKTAH